MTSLADTKHIFRERKIYLWRIEFCIGLRPRAVHVMHAGFACDKIINSLRSRPRALWNCQIFKISKFLPPLSQTRRKKFFQPHRLQTSLKQRKRQQKLYRNPQRPSRARRWSRRSWTLTLPGKDFTASFTIFVRVSFFTRRRGCFHSKSKILNG